MEVVILLRMRSSQRILNWQECIMLRIYHFFAGSTGLWFKLYRIRQIGRILYNLNTLNILQSILEEYGCSSSSKAVNQPEEIKDVFPKVAKAISGSDEKHFRFLEYCSSTYLLKRAYIASSKLQIFLKILSSPRVCRWRIKRVGRDRAIYPTPADFVSFTSSPPFGKASNHHPLLTQNQPYSSPFSTPTLPVCPLHTQTKFLLRSSHPQLLLPHCPYWSPSNSSLHFAFMQPCINSSWIC